METQATEAKANIYTATTHALSAHTCAVCYKRVEQNTEAVSSGIFTTVNGFRVAATVWIHSECYQKGDTK